MIYLQLSATGRRYEIVVFFFSLCTTTLHTTLHYTTMVTKLALRPHSLSSSFLSPKLIFSSKPSFLPKFHLFSLFSTNIPSRALIVTQPPISQSLSSYGPSLHKGAKSHHFQSSLFLPNHHEQRLGDEEERENGTIDKESFTRVFDIAAIRVPSNDCFALENRLRGHLLNWPRIRNIARVPGDEVDEEFVTLLGGEKTSDSDNEEDESSLVSLNRRLSGKAEGDGEMLSPVLHRDKLANTFNSRGFVKFRNLAKMSRPKKKNGNERGFKSKKGTGKNEFAAVEVVEDNVEGEDLSGLLGDEFKGRKWRGSTRLLLLDERYAANNGVNELPEAIKVAVPTL